MKKQNFLGGSMATAASYSTAALQDSGLEVMSIYGTEDQVLNLEKYEKYRGNLPVEISEKVIEGGNHAFFGMYGKQEGDGEANIANEVQIQITADIIVAKILENLL